jgi:ABC-type branched-subunit amino acid transport system ATPase component
MMTTLDVSDLTVRFGGLVAVNRVSIAVGEKELVGLIGPNGAGKTTFIDAVTGFQPCEGAVTMLGAALDGLRPDQRATKGLRRTFQSLDLFEDLTVGENLAVSTTKGAEASADVAWALDVTELAGVVNERPSTLPFGARRFVALARALAGRPRVLLVDEVAAGLDNEARKKVARCLRAVVDEGTSVVLVDHDMGLVMAVSDRVVVLDRGAVLASGPPREISRDETVIAAYLGRDR